MKRSNLETALSLTGSLFAVVAIFRKPLGLSEAWDWCAPILVLVCWIPLLILQRRRRAARLGGDPSVSQNRPTVRRFWFLLFLLVATALSGPLWMPYTGIKLPLSTLIVTSVATCVFAVGVFFARMEILVAKDLAKLPQTTAQLRSHLFVRPERHFSPRLASHRPELR
jgi:hypothetical protein